VLVIVLSSVPLQEPEVLCYAIMMLFECCVIVLVLYDAVLVSGAVVLCDAVWDV
jgi:hypothetical protein